MAHTRADEPADGRLVDRLRAAADAIEASTVQSFRHDRPVRQAAVRLGDLLAAMLTTAASDERELSYSSNPRERARYLSPPPSPPS